MIDSPYTEKISPKDTTPQSSSVGGGMLNIGPPSDYPIAELNSLPTSSASFEDVFRDAIVQSTSTVTDLNPGGTAPFDSPYVDKITNK